ncbi:MAG: phage terminase large subunit [Oscillospiraceae bacterium]|nr:phage terminase large subunit [Oscillospiraceae bacterium]
MELGLATAKQELFYAATARYVAYGGARGGGKSHALRITTIRNAIEFPGIRVLVVRRTYPELHANLIDGILKILPREARRYHAGRYECRLVNGSLIKFGHFNGSENEYQGQEYDLICIDEATQLTEREFRVLGACLRGANDFPKRVYLTANPGGVGHYWFKRLFIDRKYEKREKGDDYYFIQATLDDNPYLVGGDYAKMLDMLPKDLLKAHRYGDWNTLAGRFFEEFSEAEQSVEAFEIPKHWKRFRAIDYGLDMFACLWGAQSESGELTIYREFQRKGLLASEAAKLMLELTEPAEGIGYTIAPPDLWSRQKDTGRSIAEIFALNGATLAKCSNNRTAGWLEVREALRGGLKIFRNCEQLIQNLGMIQRDKLNPADCAKTPHEITHICDALRYLVRYRRTQTTPEYSEDEEQENSYEHFMLG